MNIIATVSRRSRLRAVTEAQHRRLDAMVEESDFLSGPEGYRRYLQLTLQARAPFEAMLDRSGAERIYPGWPQRRLCDALRDDLRALGEEPTATPREDGVLSEGGVLGALYVLEGSALGARVIARRAAAIGMSPERGASHLAMQTADPRAFRSFLEILEGAQLDAAGEAQCASAAAATFERFERLYCG